MKYEIHILNASGLCADSPALTIENVASIDLQQGYFAFYDDENAPLLILSAHNVGKIVRAD